MASDCFFNLLSVTQLYIMFQLLSFVIFQLCYVIIFLSSVLSIYVEMSEFQLSLLGKHLLSTYLVGTRPCAKYKVRIPFLGWKQGKSWFVLFKTNLRWNFFVKLLDYTFPDSPRQWEAPSSLLVILCILNHLVLIVY